MSPWSKAPNEVAAAQSALDRTALSEDEAERMTRVVQLIDEGDLQESLVLCQALLDKRPHHETVVFELALIYRLRGEPQRAVSALAPYSESLDAQGTAALASAYDEAGDFPWALETAAAGLERYPTSGLLYSTKGVVLEGRGKHVEAAQAYQEGLRVDPAWPSNHLHLALMHQASDLGALTLIHGEIFRNLEPSSRRSDKMAAMMFETLSERITAVEAADGEQTISVRLVPSGRLVAPEATGGDPTNPLQVFELALAIPFSVVAADGSDFEELISARRDFVRVWWEQGEKDRHPLARFLHDLDAAGHLDAYHVWLFSTIDRQAAAQWLDANPGQLEKLNAHLSAHPLENYLTMARLH